MNRATREILEDRLEKRSFKSCDSTRLRIELKLAKRAQAFCLVELEFGGARLAKLMSLLGS